MKYCCQKRAVLRDSHGTYSQNLSASEYGQCGDISANKFLYPVYGINQVIDFKGNLFCICFGQSIENPHGIKAFRLSRGACPQSYPQQLWIVEKALTKPAFSLFLQPSL
jgi:hypothetical protein